MKEIAAQYFSQWVQYRRAFDAYAEMHASYDTKLVIFDETNHLHWKEIYSRPNLATSYICNIFEGVNFYQLYYCRKYSTIYLPKRFYNERGFKAEVLQDLTDEVIDIE